MLGFTESKSSTDEKIESEATKTEKYIKGYAHFNNIISNTTQTCVLYHYKHTPQANTRGKI